MNINRTKTLAAIGLLGLASLSLAGCAASSSQAADTSSQADQGAGGADQGPRGVSGEIAAVSDGVLQVQDSDSQTAVSYTSDTTITQQVSAALSDVASGVCITGMGGDDDSSPLASVTITQPVDGECSFGPGGGAGAPGGGSGAPGGGADAAGGGTPPSDGQMPEPPSGSSESSSQGSSQSSSGSASKGAPGGSSDGAPEGMPEGGFGGFASGKVTAVNGSTITIDAVSMDGETSSKDVTVDDSTVFTKTEDATSDALAVGKCVVAMGDYSGEQYAATSLAVSDAGEDGCSAGFGGGPGRGGNPGGGSAGSANSSGANASGGNSGSGTGDE